MSAAEARIHALAYQVLNSDGMERLLALSVLREIALAVARAEDAGHFLPDDQEGPGLRLVVSNAEERP